MTGPVDDIGARLERLEAAARRAADLEEIKVLKARYFRYLDLHWWDHLRSLFTDDAGFEIAESRSQPASPDAFIAALRTHLGPAMSVHHGHMPEITLLDDEHAVGIWAMFDVVEPGAGSDHPHLTGYGHYTERYRKVDGRWRIALLRLTRLQRTADGEVTVGAVVDGPREFVEPE